MALHTDELSDISSLMKGTNQHAVGFTFSHIISSVFIVLSCSSAKTDTVKQSCLSVKQIKRNSLENVKQLKTGDTSIWQLRYFQSPADFWCWQKLKLIYLFFLSLQSVNVAAAKALLVKPVRTLLCHVHTTSITTERWQSAGNKETYHAEVAVTTSSSPQTVLKW